MKSKTAASFLVGATLGLAWACGSSGGGTAKNNSEAGASGLANSAGNSSKGGSSTGSTRSSGGDAGTASAAGGATSAACAAFGLPCQSGFDCCSGLCNSDSGVCVSVINHCQPEGASCSGATDCCNLSCSGGKCGTVQCASDAADCTSDGECCGQKCTGGVCSALNLACKTAGNSCSTGADCCSTLCKDGYCALGASYCVQNGDVCARASDCCSSVCTLAAGAAVGTCGAPLAVPANCDGVEGTVCNDCGSCCSRLCAPFGPTGVKICQPASGCRVVGELCLEDTDCCGGDATADLPGAGNGSCDKPAGSPVGRCRNAQSCSPQGNICHYKDYICDVSSAPNKCCDGVGNSGVCQLDTLGVPRCNGLGTTCRAPGEQCALADDCCNDVPCVRDPTGVLRCSTDGECVAKGGACTISGDCCPGSTCIRAAGSTSGTCGTLVTGGAGGASGSGGSSGTSTASGGQTSTTTAVTVCAEYGQQCSVTGDCCNGVPCTGGVCKIQLVIQ